jgi:hypothetical protein
MALDEALFQALAATLGYRNNKLPFTLLAQRLSLKLLRAAKDDADALIFGIAGFLPGGDLHTFADDTRPICGRCGRSGGPARGIRAPDPWPDACGN